jgi:hypothetical protein
MRGLVPTACCSAVISLCLEKAMSQPYHSVVVALSEPCQANVWHVVGSWLALCWQAGQTLDYSLLLWLLILSVQ